MWIYGIVVKTFAERSQESARNVSEGFVRAQREAVNVLPPTEAGAPNELSQ